MADRIFDVIIIGGGVAGISTALWCDELGLDAILLESGPELGGQLLWTFNPIENYLGRIAKNGAALRDIFQEHLAGRKTNIRFNTNVAAVDAAKKSALIGRDEELFASAIVIATGVRRRAPDVENFARFKGSGILESGKRDKELAAGKTALVVGGGDAAFENALILSETAEKVILVHRRAEFRARPEFVEKVGRNARIEVFPNTILRSLEGAVAIEAAILENTVSGERHSCRIGTVIFRIGVMPNTEIVADQIELDESGYIKISDTCQSSVEGVFAVGDVANPVSPTIASAAGMGSTAAKKIYSLLN